ncbi:hypothetical protein B5H70_004538 [Shigella boydii]|nr:hypothetical protein [Shigella boydii]
MNISDYINSYIEWLTKEVSLYPVDKKIKFGIWCIWPIVNEKDVAVFLDKVNGDATLDNIRSNLELIWNDNYNNASIAHLIDFIDKIDWNNDLVDNNDQNAAQGVLDLLNGVSCLTHGYLNNSNEYIANCAELAINRVDYLIGFEKIKSVAMDKEIDVQKEAVRLFSKCDVLPSLQNRKRWLE